MTLSSVINGCPHGYPEYGFNRPKSFLEYFTCERFLQGTCRKCVTAVRRASFGRWLVAVGLFVSCVLRRVVKRWDVNTVLSVNTNNRTTLDFLNNNKLNVWDFH